ncbi:hypothetical protein P3553_17460 [Vibrio parahaemolyticus]|uniref:hypothetical protein n=1 Tax=Vibrio parahaemolyticus TaxID=670 RepID=UPI001A90AB24|nr:hypothetical protein [Vibrio parahaemolyticus]EIN4364780.1 hypothetical protein [Vibrio parahaemolyticus]EJB8544263.1 hypothetical protein [Vibrio parahaemolyticus]MBO0190685.1 hypothetical protein [Vibrio parahaemolyticus]MBO0222204.1 hypothetical protein [Vibrio parahaemolyticus]MCR9956000.1 hypothetical protein [Vibrio parahaemolyticus]
MYQNSLDVLCLGNFKEAALYFERVIPVQCDSLRHSENGPYVTTPEHIPVDVASRLIFDCSAPSWKILEFMDKQWSPFITKLHSEFSDQISGFNTADYRKLYQNGSIGSNGVGIREHFQEFANSLGINKACILIPSNVQQSDFSSAYLNVSLKGMQLIDTKSASWEQIMEIRTDLESQKALRNLRLFINENYIGKSSAYITDDISKRIDDYEMASKKHGFELATSVLGVLLDSKNIQTSIAAGLATGILGGVEIGVGTACAVELGKGTLEIAKKYYPMKSFRENHDLAYFVRVTDKLAEC